MYINLLLLPMVNVSTLVYVLENLEDKSDELINLEEILELEQKYLGKFFEMIDRTKLEVKPALVDKILQAASTD